MEKKILPLMTKGQKNQVVKEVIYQYRIVVLTIGLLVSFISVFSVTWAVVTTKENDKIKENLINNPRVDSVLLKEILGNSYKK